MSCPIVADLRPSFKQILSAVHVFHVMLATMLHADLVSSVVICLWCYYCLVTMLCVGLVNSVALSCSIVPVRLIHLIVFYRDQSRNLICMERNI